MNFRILKSEAMKKVVLLSDKERLPAGAAEFAAMLNRQKPILLSGVFLPQVDYWNSLYYYSYGMAVPVPYYPSAIADTAELAIGQFRAMCVDQQIEFRIQEKDYKNIRDELRTETRFADLLLFSNEAFYNHLDREISAEYSGEALRLSECPVIILPENFQRPDNIILAYDGSPSSMFAIKQFAQLLPELAALPTLLIYTSGNERENIPELSHVEEYTACHFPELTLMKLGIDRSKYFNTWLSEKKNSLLVAGAQGRSSLSEMFHGSFIRDILRKHLLPVFIAHH